MKGSRGLGRYLGHAAFLGVAIAILLVGAGLVSSAVYAFRGPSEQSSRFRKFKSMQRDAGKADSLSLLYASVLQDLQGIRAALPGQNQGSFVLNVLVEEARKQELGIAGIDALDEVIFPGYVELPFELSFSGGLPSLAQYLYALETQGMVLQVRRLSVESEAWNKARIKAKLELSVFIPGTRKPAASATPAPPENPPP